MKGRPYDLYVEDILESIDKIENYISGLEYEEFSKNTMVIDAVLRNLEIIGEAAKHPRVERFRSGKGKSGTIGSGENSQGFSGENEKRKRNG